jgi:hypothetical protein
MHVATPSPQDGKSLWYYLDSGASGHYVPNIKNLYNFRIYNNPKNIQTANRTYVQAKGAGMLKFHAMDWGEQLGGA